MAEGNGIGNSEHIAKLNILLETSAPAEELMPALTRCFVDVLRQMEEREKRQAKIDKVLFGDEELEVAGLVNEIRPIIKGYKTLKIIVALVWIPGAAIIIALWEFLKEYFKRKLIG